MAVPKEKTCEFCGEVHHSDDTLFSFCQRALVEKIVVLRADVEALKAEIIALKHDNGILGEALDERDEYPEHPEAQP